MSRIKVRVTNSLEKVYKVKNGMTVGRDPKNTIQLLAQPVSRNHAQFVVTEDRVVLLDLGSSNGTKVNGERVAEVVLQEGDVIDIGGVIMTYEKEVAHVADENIFTLESTDVSEEMMARIADRAELGLVLASDADLVDLAYNVSRKYLERIGLPEDDNVNVLTALYEAMDNAKRHGNKADPTKRIRLFFMDFPDRVSMSVVDEGKGFDYATILQRTEEQDALSAARERYMAGGMGGLGIRLMLKCVDKIEYEQEGSKIVLTKFKQPVEVEEPEDKELTTEEKVYRTTLWDEMAKAEKDKPSEMEDKPARQKTQEEPPAQEKAEEGADDAAARPHERVRRFEDRLSQFFLLDGRDGLKSVSGKELDEELKKHRGKEASESESSDDLQINMPDHIQTENDPPDADNLDVES
jgi:anti-sigma regulatory factor (Ser/Thr protein kinase)